MNVPEDFVQSLDTPAAPLLEDKVEETTTDSQTEEKPKGTDKEKDTEKDKGEGKEKIPFHKHPRWIKREAQWNAKLDAIKEATTQEIKGLKELIGNRQSEQKELTEDDIPAWFGGELSEYKKFHKDQTAMIKNAVESNTKDVTKKLEEKSGSDEKGIKEATVWFKEEIDRIENDDDLNPSGDTIDQAELLEIARENDLVDSQGRWNWKAAFRIYAKEHNSEKSEAEKTKEKAKAKKDKKEVAAISSKKDEEADDTQAPIATSKSLKEFDW